MFELYSLPDLKCAESSTLINCKKGMETRKSSYIYIIVLYIYINIYAGLHIALLYIPNVRSH